MATVAPESAMAGLDPMFQPDWFFTDEQLRLLERLKEICEETIRPLAAENDRTLTFPRKSLEALGPDGFLGLMLPKEWGGLGQNHVMYAAVTETIARHGDASCAMCYVMHIGAVEALKLRATEYTIEKYLKKVKDGLIGTLSYSDPETGSHFWYPIASGARQVDGGYEVLKKASWTTSAGFADFYVLQTTSPDYNGDYSNLSVFVVDKDEIEAKPQEWDAMGLRGNQSGTLLLDWKFVPGEQLVGPIGDGANSNDEAVDPFFLLCSSACWNGIALGLIDIAKNHTTRKTHVDVGMRVADYPTIQDYVGEAIIDTNTSRAFVFQMAKAMDDVTNNCDWSIHKDPTVLPRAKLLHWMWQVKFAAAKNVAHVGDKMLHACGGTGYKPALGIERYLRDGKAGWVMGPTNEVLRQFVGKMALLGIASLDYWNQSLNERVLNNELKKMDKSAKLALAKKLMAEADTKAAE
jgi:alkylation response protein AidB-like acyl-CoA dehydrogenase